MKIENDILKAKIVEIQPNIFAVVIKDSYDRAMLFCRYQEFYESPIKEIRGSYFTMEKFMKLYKTKYKKATFTYPIDWMGYNIPSSILQKAIFTFIDSDSEYDIIMRQIVKYCEKKSKSPIWYLLGVDKEHSGTMNHEIAHGLFYTNEDYNKACQKLIESIKPQHYQKLRKALIKLGYNDCKEIIDDEIQAFMSTGLYSTMTSETMKKYEKDFIKNFKKYKICKRKN